MGAVMSEQNSCHGIKKENEDKLLQSYCRYQQGADINSGLGGKMARLIALPQGMQGNMEESKRTSTFKATHEV